MKLTLPFLTIPFLLASCAKDSIDEETKKVVPTSAATQPAVVAPALPSLKAPTTTVQQNNKADSFVKYSNVTNPYGELKDADAPATKSELEANAEPINVTPKNVITPPPSGQ